MTLEEAVPAIEARVENLERIVAGLNDVVVGSGALPPNPLAGTQAEPAFEAEVDRLRARCARYDEACRFCLDLLGRHVGPNRTLTLAEHIDKQWRVDEARHAIDLLLAARAQTEDRGYPGFGAKP